MKTTTKKNVLGYKAFQVFLFFGKIFLSVFPFDVWDGLWALIRIVPEVSLLY